MSTQHIIRRGMMLALLLIPTQVWAAVPEVSNVEVHQIPATFDVNITFDLFDADGDLMTMAVMLSTDGGQTWPVRCDSLTGQWWNLDSGAGYNLVWHAGGDFPGFEGDQCRLRLFANDYPAPPSIDFFRISGIDTIPVTADTPDTVGFGHPYHLYWTGNAPVAQGLSPLMLAQMDTVYPFDDGVLGFKWRYLRDECIPSLEDCWHPRYFNEATGDSVSYFGQNHQLYFLNDGSGPGMFEGLLVSGDYPLAINTIDLVQDEVPEGYLQEYTFIVNYDPETIILDGETDWAHPEDPQVYPYYILLNDPTQQRHPFQSGDNIPDRTYVVAKALFKDDPRDIIVGPDIGLTGHVRGVRQNFTGGTYTFQTDASEIDTEPTWEMGTDGWYADTLGFLTAPRCEFTFNMQGVDEHGRRDGTPANLTFSVGNPPCVQCVELLPNLTEPSAYTPDLECYDPDAGQHACFGDTTTYFVKSTSSPEQPGRTYLEQTGINYLAIDKATLAAEFVDEVPNEEWYYSFACNVFSVSVLLHSQDDPRETWDNPAWRSLAWQYQVDYECDPWNAIQDGGGIDDITRVNWGETYGSDLLQVDLTTGLWRLNVQVAVPQLLLTVGAPSFYQVIMFTMANGDAELADDIYNICLRQLSSGTVMATALDQTQCGVAPFGRPAKYHLFHGVRPSVEDPGPETWRACNASWPDLYFDLDLDQNSMASNDGEPVTQHFKLILQDVSGEDVTCDAEVRGPMQSAWYDAE